MEVEMARQPRDGRGGGSAQIEEPKPKRAERRSRSVLLHGYGGSTLRVFGTYVVDDDGQARNIVVRAYHRPSASEPQQPSDATRLSTIEEMEDEIKDWEMRANAIGYKRLSNRIGSEGKFTKDAIPVVKPPKPGVFTKGGIPDPLAVKHGGGGGRGRR